MSKTILTRTWLATVLVAGLALATASAQDEAAPAQPELDPLAVDDHLIQAVLETGPTSPEELVRAARVLMDLERHAAARALLSQVLEANPDAETLAALAERYGSATFIRMSSAEELQPEGRQLARLVLDAAQNRARDPARIADAIDALDAANLERRSAAQRQLRSAGPAAVAVAVSLLTDDEDPAKRDAARRALILLGPQAAEPLIALLRAEDPSLRISAIDVLGHVGDAQTAAHLLATAIDVGGNEDQREVARVAVERLLGYLPSRRDAFEYLLRRARMSYERLSDAASDEDLAIDVVWTWNPGERTLVAGEVDRDTAELVNSVRLARDAVRLDPNSRAAQRIFLTAILDLDERRRRGAGTAIDPNVHDMDVVADLDAAALVEVLDYAMANGHSEAAAAAARLLGEQGDPGVLRSGGAHPSVLARALVNADDRLRFAALEAVMKLRPEGHFPGSSYVARALEYFATARGAPLALVAMRRLEDASRIGSMLREMGYEVEVTTDALDMVRNAKTSADAQFVLLDFLLDDPPAFQTLAHLRRDARTAELPVGLVARLDRIEGAERLARSRENAWAVVYPPDQEGLALAMRPIPAAARRAQPSPKQRRQFAAQALEWINMLAREHPRAYDLRSLEGVLLASLEVTDLSDQAILALAQTNTPAAQQALVDLASQHAEPVEARRKAAEAFAAHVANYGVLLTHSNILRQYDRYNESEAESRETQEILAFLLDKLEERVFAESRAAADAPPPRATEVR